MALSAQQRRKRALVMKRNKAKIARGRARAKRKTPTKDALMKRAEKRARKVLMTKYAKDKDLETMSAAQKASIEKKVSKKKDVLDRMTKKIYQKMKQKK